MEGLKTRRAIEIRVKKPITASIATATVLRHSPVIRAAPRIVSVRESAIAATPDENDRKSR